MFVDSAGWLATADAGEPDHHAVCAARDQWMALGGVLITSDFVWDETLTLLKRELGSKACEVWWRRVESSPRVRTETVNSERLDRARELFFRHGDKDYSLTDCTSFVLMRELKLTTVLTLDRHFRQMRFVVLPA